MRRQYLALKSEPSRADVTSASQEIDAWLQTFGSGGSANKAATSSAVDDTWTPKEREFAANREKIKGNEAFRAGETEKAIVHYTKSLELKPRDAVVLANRYRGFVWRSVTRCLWSVSCFQVTGTFEGEAVRAGGTGCFCSHFRRPKVSR